MSYKKGKDIKVPFDCLWHCYTRKFESLIIKCTPHTMNANSSLIITTETWHKPEEFEKW